MFTFASMYLQKGKVKAVERPYPSSRHPASSAGQSLCSACQSPRPPPKSVERRGGLGALALGAVLGRPLLSRTDQLNSSLSPLRPARPPDSRKTAAVPHRRGSGWGGAGRFQRGPDGTGGRAWCKVSCESWGSQLRSSSSPPPPQSALRGRRSTSLSQCGAAEPTAAVLSASLGEACVGGLRQLWSYGGVRGQGSRHTIRQLTD